MAWKDPHRYDDMLDMPRPISKRHLPMSSLNRAAIFSPFAALTGFDAKIQDAQHRRCNQILLSEDEQAPINDVLSNLKKGDIVEVTYFLLNPGTDGSGGFAEGEYLTVTGTVTKLEPAFHSFRVSMDDTWVDLVFEDIHAIQKL